MLKDKEKPAAPPTPSAGHPAGMLGACFGIIASVAFITHETGALAPKILIAAPTFGMVAAGILLGINNANQHPSETQEYPAVLGKEHLIGMLIVPIIAVLAAEYLPSYNQTFTALACVAAGVMISYASYQVGRNSRPKPQFEDDDEPNC